MPFDVFQSTGLRKEPAVPYPIVIAVNERMLDGKQAPVVSREHATLRNDQIVRNVLAVTLKNLTHHRCSKPIQEKSIFAPWYRLIAGCGCAVEAGGGSLVCIEDLFKVPTALRHGRHTRQTLNARPGQYHEHSNNNVE